MDGNGEEVQEYVNKRGRYRLTKYKSGTLIIIDDVDPDQAQNNTHARRCNSIRRLFEECTNCEVRSLQLPAGSTVADFRVAWHNELARKGHGDLIIPYYHGRAIGNGHDWQWLFSGYPREPVNAFNFVDTANHSDCDIMMIIDGWLPTRFIEKWERNTWEYGNTEMFCNGKEMPLPNGTVAGVFTEALVNKVEAWVESVVADKKRRPRHKAPRSILEIMGNKPEVDSNPTRVWIDRPQDPHERLINRVNVVPWEVRKAGRIEFFYKQVQPLLDRYQGYGPVQRAEGEDGVQEREVVGGNGVEGEEGDEGFDEPDHEGGASIDEVNGEVAEESEVGNGSLFM